MIPACVIAGVVIVGDIETPDAAAPAGSIAFARPKSNTFTVPSARTLMLAGLRSRWMIPWSCAASSASAICLAMGSVSSTGIWPCATRSASVSLNKLHDEGSDPISGLEPIDSGDVRVIERRENLGFTPEASEAFSIDHEGVGK